MPAGESSLAVRRQIGPVEQDQGARHMGEQPLGQSQAVMAGVRLTGREKDMQSFGMDREVCDSR